MEKTSSYAINEAIETGYRAGRLGNTFDEMALRERIAQEIESSTVTAGTNITEESVKTILNYCAEIARGTSLDRS